MSDQIDQTSMHEEFTSSTLKLQPKLVLPAKTSVNPNKLKLNFKLTDATNESLNTLKPKLKSTIKSETVSQENDDHNENEDDDYDYDIPENNKPTVNIENKSIENSKM